jgi:hypothetical protein
MWTDGQTNMVKLINAFRDYANSPKESNPPNQLRWFLVVAQYPMNLLIGGAVSGAAPCNMELPCAISSQLSVSKYSGVNAAPR